MHFSRRVNTEAIRTRKQKLPFHRARGHLAGLFARQRFVPMHIDNCYFVCCFLVPNIAQASGRSGALAAWYMVTSIRSAQVKRESDLLELLYSRGSILVHGLSGSNVLRFPKKRSPSSQEVTASRERIGFHSRHDYAKVTIGHQMKMEVVSWSPCSAS